MRKRRAAEGFGKRINTEDAGDTELAEKKVRRRTKENGKRAAIWPPFLLLGTLRLSAAFAVIFVAAIAAVAAEVEEVEEIAEGRAVERHVGIVFVDYGIREIVAAALC
jgi:hypothetical protein